MPKVSVLIPVYNTKKTLARCLDSVLRQTFKDIEVICVDDGSDAETKKILHDYAKKDARVRICTHEQNLGTFCVRKRQIEEAKGEYAMFLDSDDEFIPETCERALYAIEKKKADVVGFGTEVIREERISNLQTAILRGRLHQKCGSLTGDKIFYSFFKPSSYRSGWNLWNKIYKTKLLCEAVRYIPAKKCVMAEDFLITFIVMARARKYYGIKDKLLRYYFGKGISTSSELSLERLIWLARREEACKAAETFLEDSRMLEGDYKKTLSAWREDFFHSTLLQWAEKCPAEYAPEVFDEIISQYGAAEVAGELAKLYGASRTAELAEKIEGSRLSAPCNRKIKTVAFFYYRYYNGGIERVLSLLIPKFLEWGYKTILFVEKESESEYALPQGCIKVCLPTSDKCGGKIYAEHAAAFSEALQKYEVDAVLYQAAASEYLLYDLIVAKGSGAGFFVSMHEMLGLPLLHNGTGFGSQGYVLRLADGVQSLARSDAALLSAAGVRAHYITNPCGYSLAEKITPANKTVIWVGRFDDLQKRPRDALRVMAEVVQKCEGARLVMVGTAGNKRADKQYKKYAKRLGIENYVEFAGFCPDPAKYYESASLLLMTSAFEACSMVLLEAMSKGLPVVSYEMPYQEPLRQNEGCICVGQGDVSAAARAIVGLFEKKETRAEMANASLRAARAFAAADIRSGWENMLSGSAERCHTDAQDLRIGMDSLFGFYRRSFGRTNGGIMKLGVLYLKKHGVVATVRRVFVYIRVHGLKNVIRRLFGK